KSGASGFLPAHTSLTRRAPRPASTMRQASSASSPATIASAATWSIRRNGRLRRGSSPTLLLVPATAVAAHEPHHQEHPEWARESADSDQVRKHRPQPPTTGCQLAPEFVER